MGSIGAKQVMTSSTLASRSLLDMGYSQLGTYFSQHRKELGLTVNVL